MSYRPEIVFLEGANDITEDVIALEGSHGVDIFGGKRDYKRADTGGRLILDNWDGYWTIARLDALGVIEMRQKTDVLCRWRVLEYEIRRREKRVDVTLASASTRNPEDVVMINSGNVPGQPGTSLSLAQVVATAGITITPEQPWESGLHMDQGTVYEAAGNQFLDDLAIAGDGFVYEDHLGELRFLAWADNRGQSLQITPHDFRIEDDTAESYLRRGWRRDSQVVKTLSVTFVEDPESFDPGQRANALGYWQTFGGVSHVRVLHLTPLRNVGGASYEQPIERFAYHESFPGTFHIVRRPPPFTGPFPSDWFITSVGAPYINPDDPREILVRIQLTGNFSGQWSNLWLTSQFRIVSQFFPEMFTENTYRLTARDDGMTLLGELPAMPWPVDDAMLDTLGERVGDWATRIGQVTKLVFPLMQADENKFNSLVRHRIGSVSFMNIDIDGLRVIGYMGNLFIGWRFERGRYGSVEMHFLELPDAGVTFADNALVWRGEEVAWAGEELRWR